MHRIHNLHIRQVGYFQDCRGDLFKAFTCRKLAGHPHIRLIEPLDYILFVDLMRRSYLLLTDSGGIQEEAPSLGKPVLVLREKTERPEAVEAGTATLVGTDVRKIVDSTRVLVENACEYERRRRIQNPYGDGMASSRIARFILDCEELLGAAR
jgi:UDP-N-acetylglucosamine 2-epimerase (non-hydrolysing)